ncbi:MAG: glycosyltransferase family 4 protein [Cyanobacteria bacterium P01_A01_bin.15]
MQQSRKIQQLRLVFWWPTACRSIMPLVRELAELCTNGVRIIVQEKVGSNRRKFGWQADHAGNAEFEVLPVNNRWRDVERILIEESQSFHVIGGYQRIPLHRQIISYAKAQDIAYGIMAEAPLKFELSWKSFSKTIYFESIVRARTSLVKEKSKFFACLSGHSYDTLLKVGWPIEKIYPFGYFPQAKDVKVSFQSSNKQEGCQLLCMGTLHKYKGVDLLLKAIYMAQKLGSNCTINIIGDGPERIKLEALTKRLKIQECVKFHGFISDSALNGVIEQSDVLVCPGIAEPWGIRINEGIQSGLAIIASDRLGASKLVETSGAGILFKSGDVGELAEAIRVVSTKTTDIVESFKRKASEYSEMIHPRVAAEHFYQIIEHSIGNIHERPFNPWQKLSHREKISIYHS